MIKITGSMVKLGMVLNTRLCAGRAYRNRSTVGAGSIKLVLLVVWAMEGQPLTHREISDITGLSYTQAHRSVSLLVKQGFVRAEKVGRVTKRYSLDMGVIRARQLDDIPGPLDMARGFQEVS